MSLLIFSWRRMGCFSSCSLFHFGTKSGYTRNQEFCGNSCKNDMAERGCDWNTILVSIFSVLLNEVDSDPLLLIKTQCRQFLHFQASNSVSAASSQLGRSKKKCKDLLVSLLHVKKMFSIHVHMEDASWICLKSCSEGYHVALTHL